MKWWQIGKRHTDLERELQSDLELEEEEQLQRGLPPEQARRAARRAFGNTTLIKEHTHEAWGWAPFERLFQDIRYAFRQQRRSPGFAAAAIFTLALGIGASTAIFSITDAVLLRPLPYSNPQQIVRVWEQAPDGHRMNLAQPNFDDFRTRNATFASLAEYGERTASISGGGEPARATVTFVSIGFFKTLGVEPFLGRAFVNEEQRPHGAPAVIVSYRYWTQYLGSVENISKFHLKIAGSDYPIIGVMPAAFDFPSGTAAWISSELDPDSSTRTAHNWRGIGRVRDGISVAQTRANLSAIAHRLKEQYGKEVDLSDAAVVPLADAIVGDVRTAVLVLLGAVGMLLLVACANVAGLLFARASARNKELAVRAALGAGRARLVHQFLAESLTLSLAAGVLGVLIAALGVKSFPAILPADLPRHEEVAINAPVLLFALAATIAVALSLGVLTAWRAVGTDLRSALSTGSQNYSGSSASQRLRGFLVVGEIAMTLVVLVGAGLLGRSFLRLISTNPGFRSENLITMQFSLPESMGMTDPAAVARQVTLMENVVARLRLIAGAKSVGLAGALPVAAGDNLADGNFLLLRGQAAPTNFDEWDLIARNPVNVGHALYSVASREYFRTLEIPLISGRLFDEQDNLGSPNVALISETLAHQRWPNQNPIGQVIDFGNMDGNPKPLTIIGVVGDIRARGLNLPTSPIIYVDYRQRGLNVNSTPTILIRTVVPDDDIFSAARGIFHDLAPDAPVKFSTFEAEMGGWLADRRFLLFLVGFFAAAALALVAVGLYGVIAFFVTRRTQEIGIRMAIGAQRSDVLRLVLGEGLRLAAFGVIIGVIASLATSRLLSSLLFGISANDPITLAGVALVLSLIALAASYIPARRAMRVDPTTALRYE
jgi:putative ABC transport system permease protein